jgi:hypothetical protein
VTSGEPLFNSINAGKPFGSGAPPGPGRWGSSQRSPRPLAGCRGPLRGGREGEGRGKGKEGEERKRRKDGKGRRKWRGGTGKTMEPPDFVDAPRRIFVAPPPLKIC